jgi:hypothetical protein
LWRQESAQGINPWGVGIRAILFGAVPLKDQKLRSGSVVAEFGGKPALADTSFAGEKNAAPCAFLSGTQRVIEDFQFVCASDQYRRAYGFGHKQ